MQSHDLRLKPEYSRPRRLPASRERGIAHVLLAGKQAESCDPAKHRPCRTLSGGASFPVKVVFFVLFQGYCSIACSPICSVVSCCTKEWCSGPNDKWQGLNKSHPSYHPILDRIGTGSASSPTSQGSSGVWSLPRASTPLVAPSHQTPGYWCYSSPSHRASFVKLNNPRSDAGQVSALPSPAA